MTVLQATGVAEDQKVGEFREVNCCPICAEKYSLLARVPTINKHSRLCVELRECVYCKHWWHSPAPTQTTLNRLYAEASPYVVNFGRHTGYPKKHRLDGFARFAINCAKNLQGGNRSYLELGIGGGYLLRRFERLGYSCLGVDPGSKTGDPNVFPCCDVLPHGMKFSLIVLQDVLEHVHNPIGLLQELRGLAAPESKILCSFPMKDSRLATVRKERWRMILPFGHLHYFSRSSTLEAFSRAGWQIETQRQAHPASLLSLLASGRVATLLHELLQRGSDQLYVSASPLEGEA